MGTLMRPVSGLACSPRRLNSARDGLNFICISNLPGSPVALSAACTKPMVGLNSSAPSRKPRGTWVRHLSAMLPRLRSTSGMR